MGEEDNEIDYGDFEELDNNNNNKENKENGQEGIVRARLPKKGEIIGKIVQRLGGNKMDVLCADGKRRNCRVPGRFKRSMWLRPGDFVLITPWPDDDNKGDVVYQYSSNSVNQLRKKGLIENIKEDF